ncbi:MAG: cysteine desulfurase family protein [bacterium]
MIYLDYASTTPVDKKVLEVMLPYFGEKYANPSAIYEAGLEANEAVESSRQNIAKFLHCQKDEIIFTSGGTESDNLAIFGIAKNFKSGHIITSAIEHPAVLEPCRQLEKEGFKVTYLKPNKKGLISAVQVKEALQKNTILVSIMYANNEIGTVQPIVEIGRVIQNFRKLKIKNQKLKIEKAYPLFHTDSCQATQYLQMDVKKLGVDLLTINGSKIYAPKGIGVLFAKNEVDLLPQIIGGEQEGGLRGGTQNVPSIVGLSKAVDLISSSKIAREKKLRDYLIKELKQIKGVSINGSLLRRLPNNVNFSISGVEGESVLLDLDKAGIAVSTGSACSSRSLKPSHVITTLSSEERSHESIRVSLGRFTKKSDLDILLKHLKKSIKRLRDIS